MAKLTDIFEHRECSRCGGSGHYSFNQIDGTRCYGCGGTGRQWTKADAPLVAEYHELAKPLRETTAGRLEVGEDVLLGERYFAEGRRMRRWVTIESIEVDESQWSSASGSREDGTWHVTGYYRTLHFTNGTSERMSDNVIVRRKFRGIRDERLLAAASPELRARLTAYLEAHDTEEGR